jgi:hypothetical protein
LSYDITSDVQVVQWHKPLRANSSYLEQATRLLIFIKTTKFGFISLQRALKKLGLSVYDMKNTLPVNRKIEKQMIRLSNYSAMEVSDVEDGSSLLIYA